MFIAGGIVVACVCLGVWGPHLAPRSSLSASAPLGDLLGVIARVEAEFPDDPWQTPPERALSSPSTANDIRWRQVTNAPLPALEASGWRLVACLDLPGQTSSCVVALFRAPSSAAGELLSICAAASPAHWHVFDRFGRSGPLLPDEPIMESPDWQGTVDRPTMAWSDERCVYLARGASIESLNELRPLLGAP